MMLGRRKFALRFFELPLHEVDPLVAHIEILLEEFLLCIKQLEGVLVALLCPHQVVVDLLAQPLDVSQFVGVVSSSIGVVVGAS